MSVLSQLERENTGYNTGGSPARRSNASSASATTGSSGLGYATEYRNWYLDYISQYQDNPELYNMLLNNNPYTIDNSGDYVPSWVEDFFGFAGTNAEKYRNNLRAQAVDWVADLVDKYNTRGYDSAMEQVNRMKLAGQNVDLNGGQGVSPGDPGSSNLAESGPIGQPLADVSVAQQSVSSVANGAMQLVSTAMSFAQSFQGLQKGNLELFLGDLEADKSVYSILQDTIARSISPEMWNTYNSPKSNPEDVFLVSDVIQNALDGLADDKRFSRSTRKRFSRYFPDGYAKSIEGKKFITNLMSGYYKDVADIGKAGATPFFDEDLGAMLSSVGDFVNQYIVEVDKLQAKFDKSRLSVSKDGKDLGTLAGESEASAYTAEMLSADVDTAEKSFWDNLYDHFVGKKDFWSNVALFVIPLLRGYLNSVKAPRVSHSTGGRHDIRDVYIH